MLLTHICTWTKIAAQLGYLRLRYWNRQSEFYSSALQLLRNENILFTKIFQSLAHSKNTRVSPELHAQLMHYTTNSSFTESEVDYETLSEIEELYSYTIDRNVINSGMIALVFKGMDASGEPIIVKLKRKDIYPKLQRGCEAVKTFFSHANWLRPQNTLLHLIKPFVTNIDDILDQCDFAHEIENLRQAKDDFAVLEFITIPTVYNRDEHIHNTPFIIMNFIDGTHTLPPNTVDSERLRYLDYFSRYMCYGFVHNTIQHTDLHSGNIIFRPTGLGIIDFGMAFQLTSEMNDMISSVVMILVNQTPIHEIDFIDTFKELFVPNLDRTLISDSSVEAIEDLCISITEPMFIGLEFDDIVISNNLAQLSELIGEPVVIHTDLYKILLGLSMMGNNAAIMGQNYKHPDKIRDIERKALEDIIMNVMIS